MQVMEPGARPDLSVVIVNRNTRELLRACLRSIQDLRDRTSREIIVVDNGSDDGSVEMLSSEFPGVRLIRNHENTGFAYPNNQGIKVSRGRYVLLLNSDTEVRDGCLDRLVDHLDGHPEVGACGPKLLFPDGSPQPSCFSFPSPWRHFCDMLHLGAVLPRSRIFANQSRWFDHERTAPADWLMGAALAVRREVLDKVGLLDERFTLYCNELDWCLRIRRAGWSVIFVHDATVVHHCGATRRLEDRDLRLQNELLDNHFEFIGKHYGRSGLVWYRLWLIVGFALRYLRITGMNLVRPSAEGDSHARFIRVVLRAALGGGPGLLFTGGSSGHW
jgi:GT2 family glycosyltransferase